MPRHTFFCIDAHTCGNPVRVVAGGAPILPNVPMAEKREIFLRDHDWVRRALMFEPRGHDVMSGTILYPPSRVDCDLGVLFIEVSGCLPMCGHGTIGTVTAAIEEGLLGVPAAPVAGFDCQDRTLNIVFYRLPSVSAVVHRSVCSRPCKNVHVILSLRRIRDLLVVNGTRILRRSSSG